MYLLVPRGRSVWAFVFAVLACSWSAYGQSGQPSVSLFITDSSGPPTSGTATPNSTTLSFSLFATISNDAEPVGLDYKLTASSTVPDIRVATRDISAAVTPFVDSNVNDIFANKGNYLDSDGTVNLGAGVQGGNNPVPDGTVGVANYTFFIGPTAVIGQTYTISVAQLAAGTGYSALRSPFDFNLATPLPTYQVTIVPEPSSLVGLGLVASMTLIRRRRRSDSLRR